MHSGKVKWDPPRVGQIDRQTRVNALPSHTTDAGGKKTKKKSVAKIHLVEIMTLYFYCIHTMNFICFQKVLILI